MSGTDRHTVMQTGIAVSAVRDRSAPRSFVIRVVGDESDVALGARPVLVGAHGSCDVILSDPRASRRHAELKATPEGVLVRDLGSTNGTFWQGSRVTEVVVPSGSKLTFGDTDAHIRSAEIPILAPSARTHFGALVGASRAMRELFAVLEMVSPTDATILIEGESGTGKEVAAHAIHDHSERAAAPLIVVDCSAISEQLLESHLFGHKKGAFTGANTERRGAFVEANGGTVFLDEIGELPLSAQTKLLRVLEAQTVQPVGADSPVSVNTRVIAASHRNLQAMVERKEFRFDLFYRLAVVHAYIPPLRERLEDLPILLETFYRGRGVPAGPIKGDNLKRLHQHGWPGNVRELRNVLERAWALSGPSGAAFTALQLWMQTARAASSAGPEVNTSLPFKEAKERWNDAFEAQYLREVFDQCGQNITHTAEKAGVNRRHIRTLLRKHGIISP